MKYDNGGRKMYEVFDNDGLAVPSFFSEDMKFKEFIEKIEYRYPETKGAMIEIDNNFIYFYIDKDHKQVYGVL